MFKRGRRDFAIYLFEASHRPEKENSGLSFYEQSEMLESKQKKHSFEKLCETK